MSKTEHQCNVWFPQCAMKCNMKVWTITWKTLQMYSMLPSHKNYVQSVTWNTILLDKLIAPHLDMKFFTFHGIWMFITMFTAAHHFFLFSSRWIQFTHSHHKSHFNINLPPMLDAKQTLSFRLFRIQATLTLNILFILYYWWDNFSSNLPFHYVGSYFTGKGYYMRNLR